MAEIRGRVCRPFRQGFGVLTEDIDPAAVLVLPDRTDIHCGAFDLPLCLPRTGVGGAIRQQCCLGAKWQDTRIRDAEFCHRRSLFKLLGMIVPPGKAAWIDAQKLRMQCGPVSRDIALLQCGPDGGFCG